MAVLRNAKHEHFAHMIAKGESPQKAYVLAGYSEQGCAQSSSRLLKNADICERIAQIQVGVTARAVEKTGYGLAEAMAEAEEARRFATSLDNPNAVIAAVSLKAKLNGLLIDRKEIRTGALDDKSEDELDSIIRRSATEAKVSFGVAGEGSETQH